jgi:hypothetical protein
MVSELLEDTLFSYSQKFISKLESIEGNTEIPTEDFGWDNFRYESYHYRLAHTRRFSCFTHYLFSTPQLCSSYIWVGHCWKYKTKQSDGCVFRLFTNIT